MEAIFERLYSDSRNEEKSDNFMWCENCGSQLQWSEEHISHMFHGPRGYMMEKYFCDLNCVSEFLDKTDGDPNEGTVSE